MRLRSLVFHTLRHVARAPFFRLTGLVIAALSLAQPSPAQTAPMQTACVNSSGALSTTSGCPIFNVRNYGALGNGSNDDSGAINSAIAAASPNSGPVTGGVVYFPPGTYLACTYTIAIPSGVYLVGSGQPNTIIKACSTMPTNQDLVHTFNWNTANCQAGSYSNCPYNFGISFMTLDGNSARASGTGNVLGIRGNRYFIEETDVLNGPNDGIYSEMVGAVPTPPYLGYGTSISYGNSAQWRSVRSSYNHNNGIEFYGPPDSILTDVIPFLNSNYGAKFGCLSGSNSGVCGANVYLTDFHAWNNTNYGLELETWAQGNNIQSESNHGGGVDVNPGPLHVSGVQTWNNIGIGLNINGIPSTTTSFGNVLSGVESFSNCGPTGWGIVGQPGASKTTMSNVMVTNNLGGGIQWASQDSSLTGIVVKYNGTSLGTSNCTSNTTANGLDLSQASNLSFVNITGEITGNTGTQVLYPSGAHSSFLTLGVYTQPGETQFSGTPPAGLQANVSYGGTATGITSTLVAGASASGNALGQILCSSTAAQTATTVESTPTAIFTCTIPAALFAWPHVFRAHFAWTHTSGTAAVTYAFQLGTGSGTTCESWNDGTPSGIYFQDIDVLITEAGTVQCSLPSAQVATSTSAAFVPNSQAASSAPTNASPTIYLMVSGSGEVTPNEMMVTAY
jgi:hypothetical protein